MPSRERLIGEKQQYKAFLLAVCAGLRRSEIDLLEWDAFDFKQRKLHGIPQSKNRGEPGGDRH